MGLMREAGDRWTVTASRPLDYVVQVVPGLCNPTTPIPPGLLGPPDDRPRLVVADGAVWATYGEGIAARLSREGIAVRVVTLDLDEARKTWAAVERVTTALSRAQTLRRSAPPIAIGGGVLLDVVGLAASLYRRGVPWIRVPTTLVGQIDAGIGAKTGIDHHGHKNRLGSYHPATTLIDPALLATLPRRRIADGLAEVLKVAIMRDGDLFVLLESWGPALLDERMQGTSPESADAAHAVITRAIHGMLSELAPNLDESGPLERRMDYGHLVSPAVEMAALPRLLHGEAVALDMALSACIAAGRGLVTTSQRDRMLRAIRSLELPLWDVAMRLQTVWAGVADATLHRDGQQRAPLPNGIGSATWVDDLTEIEISTALATLRELAVTE